MLYPVKLGRKTIIFGAMLCYGKGVLRRDWVEKSKFWVKSGRVHTRSKVSLLKAVGRM
jgi:hypothetical protein